MDNPPRQIWKNPCGIKAGSSQAWDVMESVGNVEHLQVAWESEHGRQKSLRIPDNASESFRILQSTQLDAWSWRAQVKWLTMSRVAVGISNAPKCFSSCKRLGISYPSIRNLFTRAASPIKKERKKRVWKRRRAEGGGGREGGGEGGGGWKRPICSPCKKNDRSEREREKERNHLERFLSLNEWIKSSRKRSSPKHQKQFH